jgi:hypothetical protein
MQQLKRFNLTGGRNKMDKTKIYQSMKIGELESAVDKLVYNLKIEGIRFVEGAFDCGKTDGLFLDFKSHRMLPDKKYSYGLVGKALQDEFMKDMGVEKRDELVGREVMAVIEKENKTWEGIVPYKIK